MGARSPVIALLGPTNTGKTYHAMERLMAHRTGMIGFPLRLLARENYDRLVKARGESAVALITGEERIAPPTATHFVCTVEAMPLDRRVDFLAVDEIQLAADRERGHVFTDRLLNARGRQETMFLGAETIKPLLRRLIPEAGVIGRPRFSTLTYTEPRKLSRLPRRSAVVVFSLEEVYEVADRMRREAGGAAVVFGALSPRTRNAQVGLYQAGEVDYLVATDAIGMGLNLDIDHVAFTRLVKHDGIGPRRLRPAEVAQVAGRAGRHTRDGTFGATQELGPLDGDLVEAVENHRFDPLTTLFWRNPDLSFASPESLLASLERRSSSRELVRMRQADDHRALAALTAVPEIRALAAGAENVRLLWEVCQVPDFRNVMTEAHTRLLSQVYRHLRSPAGRLPEDWVAAQVAGLDRLEGGIDELLGRIAHIRTWTYVSHRASWLTDSRHWQERTRAVEDRLSDMLHERLTQQFVDRGAAVIARFEPGELIVEITPAGEVLVQGLRAGRLEGFQFVPDSGLEAGHKLRSAANRALRAEIGTRVASFVDEPDDAFGLGPSGQVLWRETAVARLLPGDEPLRPRVEAQASDLLDPPLRERVRRRVADWLASHFAKQFAPLEHADRLSGAARGIVFALRKGLGSTTRRGVSGQVAALSDDDRRALARLGVRLGRVSIYVPQLLGSEALRLRALLWAIHRGSAPLPAPRGEPSTPMTSGIPPDFYRACGYEPVGRRAVRGDRLERFAAEARRRAREGRFEVTPEMAAMVGCGNAEAAEIVSVLGLFPRVKQAGSRS